MTHDLDEALLLSDRIVVFDTGMQLLLDLPVKRSLGEDGWEFLRFRGSTSPSGAGAGAMDRGRIKRVAWKGKVVSTKRNESRHHSMRWLWPHVVFWFAIIVMAVGLEYLVRQRFVSPAAYAAPSETLVRLVTLFTEDGFAGDVWITARRALLSVLFGFPLGVAVAIGLYMLGRARSSGEMALDFVRSTPITALIPLLIALTGIGEGSKVAIGSFSAMLVTAITVWVGIKHGLQRFGLLLHLYRPTFGKRVFLLILPYTLPSMLAALKLAVSAALVLVVVAEMFLGSRGGIGKVINDRTYGDDRAASSPPWSHLDCLVTFSTCCSTECSAWSSAVLAIREATKLGLPRCDRTQGNEEQPCIEIDMDRP